MKQERKRLPHEVPLFVDIREAVYFITICCAERGRNELATPGIAQRLYDSFLYQNAQRVWYAHLFVLMPDHMHGLLSFPGTGQPIKETVRLWKHWTAAKLGIKWQRDFFEHRLRHEESFARQSQLYLKQPGARRVGGSSGGMAVRVVG
jgi:putative transposase